MKKRIRFTKFIIYTIKNLMEKINNGLESGEWSCWASKRSLFVSDLEDR